MIDSPLEYIDTGKYYCTISPSRTLRVKQKATGSKLVFSQAGSEQYLKPSGALYILNKQKRAGANASFDELCSELTFGIDLMLEKNCESWDLKYPSGRTKRSPGVPAAPNRVPRHRLRMFLILVFVMVGFIMLVAVVTRNAWAIAAATLITCGFALILLNKFAPDLD
jgi:hypothetical protein